MLTTQLYLQQTASPANREDRENILWFKIIFTRMSPRIQKSPEDTDYCSLKWMRSSWWKLDLLRDTSEYSSVNRK